jgi:hypothetical protein
MVSRWKMDISVPPLFLVVHPPLLYQPLSLSLLLAHSLLCILVELCVGQNMFEVHSKDIQCEDSVANPLTPATAWDCLKTNLCY